MRYYTGVGSRSTPKDIIERIEVIGQLLAVNQFTLRSGAADGADLAFERGCDSRRGQKEIFVPWAGFNGNQAPFIPIMPEAFALARSVHPAWHKLSDAGKRLHARNCYQVLGKDLKTPSSFLICYCPVVNGEPTGGTRTAIKLAEKYKIPVWNLFLNEIAPDDIQKIANCLVY